MLRPKQTVRRVLLIFKQELHCNMPPLLAGGRWLIIPVRKNLNFCPTELSPPICLGCGLPGSALPAPDLALPPDKCFYHWTSDTPHTPRVVTQAGSIYQCLRGYRTCDLLTWAACRTQLLLLHVKLHHHQFWISSGVIREYLTFLRWYPQSKQGTRHRIHLMVRK